MAEFYPGFVSIAWFSVSAPPKTPAAMAAIMKEDVERWRGVIRSAGVKPE
jgi:hypothetical protein